MLTYNYLSRAALHDQQSKESNLQRSPSSLQKDNYSHVDIANFWSFLDRPLLAELETYIGPDFDPAKQQTLSGEILFGMAVAVASYRSPGFQQKFVRYVSYAAQASDLSAQGIVCRILEAHGMAEKENESIKLDWLQQAASTGSLAAAEDLMRIDPPRFRAARIAFRRSGGYNYPNNANYTIAEAKPDDAFSMTVRDVSQTLIAVGTPDLALDHRGNCLLHYAATYGNCDVIEYLVGQRGADVNIQNHQDETPLYKACLSGDGATVKLLIQLGADPTIVSQPFHISCLHWLFTFDGEDMEEVAQLLHAQGKAAINATVTRSTVKQPLVTRHFPFRWPFGMPLHWAIAQRSQLAANVLLERNADINGFNLTEEDNDRETALSMAVYRRDADMVEFLIRKNADATIIDSNGRNLIHILVVNDPFNRACRLSRSIWSWTMHGSADSHIKEVRRCLQALLNCGVSLDHCRKRSQTPLVDAIENEDGCGALVLLQAGADTDILCPTGESLTQRWLRVDARRLDYPEIFKPVLSELLNHAGNLDHHDSFAGETIIHEAALCVCSNEQFEYVFDLLSSSTTQATMNLNVRDRYGATPFLKVLESLDTTDTIIRANKLMERGADISLKNNDGEDFLHYLCSNFKLSDQETLNFAKVLLKRWQLPEQKSIAQGSISKRDGSTALIKAVSSGKLECLKLLVDLGVDVDSVIKSGNMALDRAIHAADITRSSFIGKTMDSLGRAEKAEAIENHTVFEHVVSWGAYPTNGDNTDTKTQYFDRPAIVAYLKHLGAKRAQDPRLDVSNLFLTDVDLEKACCEFSTGVGFKIARKEPYVPSKQPFLDIWLPIYHISWDDHRHLPHPTQCVCCFIFASLPPALRETRVLTATLLDEILKHHPSFEDIEDFLRKS